MNNIAALFKKFLENLKVDNNDEINKTYERITRTLNKTFREINDSKNYSLKVGSYGRYTAVKNISDLDMIYIIPEDKWDYYKHDHYKLLKDVQKAISVPYHSTSIKVDRLVIVIKLSKFNIELQPAFKKQDNNGIYYSYPDTYSGGSWKITKPHQEIEAIQKLNEKTNDVLRHLCKMTRAWKNTHGINIGGLLIDTLAYNFLKDNPSTYTYKNYGDLTLLFFSYLSNVKAETFLHAPGSHQQVKIKSNFQKKALKTYKWCQEAINSNNWKNIYGRYFPSIELKPAYESLQPISYNSYDNTEQFIEDIHSVDIRYDLEIDCNIEQNGFRKFKLLDFLTKKIPLSTNRKLTFYISKLNIPKEENYSIKWKVLNKGNIAKEKNMIRGQIIDPNDGIRRTETSNFKGQHIVECYIIIDEIVVARDRILVPIGDHEYNE